MTTTEARVQKILGEIAEANTEDAVKLTHRFDSEFQVTVAEILVDAQKARKLDDAKTRLNAVLGKVHSMRDLVEIYRDLKLKPSGAERS